MHFFKRHKTSLIPTVVVYIFLLIFFNLYHIFPLYLIILIFNFIFLFSIFQAGCYTHNRCAPLVHTIKAWSHASRAVIELTHESLCDGLLHTLVVSHRDLKQVSLSNFMSVVRYLDCGYCGYYFSIMLHCRRNKARRTTPSQVQFQYERY